jgi:hypothetical protein
MEEIKMAIIYEVTYTEKENTITTICSREWLVDLIANPQITNLSWKARI